MTTKQHPIFSQLQEVGAKTLDLSPIAGFPLVLVGWHGTERIFAVPGKTKKANLKEFKETWRGRRPAEVSTFSQAVSALGVKLLTRREPKVVRPQTASNVVPIQGAATEAKPTEKAISKTKAKAKRQRKRAA